MAYVRPLRLILSGLAVVSSTVASAQSPSRASLAALEEIAVLGCASCHAELSPAGLRSAPDLLVSVSGLRPSFVAEFIAAPRSVHSATRMPDMLHGLEEEERRRTAEAIASFLAERSSAHARGTVGIDWPAGAAARGAVVFEHVGCVHCHDAPRGRWAVTGDDPRDAAGFPVRHDLTHVPGKYTRTGLADFLLRPLSHRPAGLMPDMHLSRAEAADLASYLVPDGVAPRDHDPSSLLRGASAFSEYGCASCHAGVEEPTSDARAVPLADDLSGCLALEPPEHVPDFGLDQEARVRLFVASASAVMARTKEDELRRDMAAFRCYACHERDGAGGIAVSRASALHTTEPDLGEVARRPPDLTGVGAKLRQSWLERVLLDGASVRPYMATRMPIFGADNVGHLPELFETLDEPKPLAFPVLEGDAQREARDAARELLGTTSLGCVSCHRFNAKDGPSFQGIDLITAPERLHERWFREFLIAPQKMLPGVVMPESWPGGVAAHDGLLGGDTDRQIAAIWRFLALGRSARDPRGIAEPPTFIDARGAPRVYRGRSHVAGFRGIAVGFPAAVHYAFDANNGALAAIWSGEFVSVNWNGQGAGDFQPRAKPTEISRDVAILERADQLDGWPKRPVTTEEEPVNADPLYPRQYGYRFRGYGIGEAGVPTLEYDIGDVEVEDRSVPVDGAATGEDRIALERLLTFESRGDVALIMRVATGDIEPLGDGRYRCDGALVVSVAAPARIRPAGDGDELIVELDLEGGTTELELVYEIDR